MSNVYSKYLMATVGTAVSAVKMDKQSDYKRSKDLGSYGHNPVIYFSKYNPAIYQYSCEPTIQQLHDFEKAQFQKNHKNSLENLTGVSLKDLLTQIKDKLKTGEADSLELSACDIQLSLWDVSEDWLQRLGNLTNLKHLGLGNIDLAKLFEQGNKKNIFCESLSKLTSLQSLNLVNTNLGKLLEKENKNKSAFCESLSKLTSLQSLNLNGNNLGKSFEEGDKKKSFCESLSKLTSLQSLTLSRNNLTALMIVSPLLDKLVNLTDLDLSMNQLESVGGLSKLIKLQKLDLSYNKGFTVVPKGSLSTLTSLQSLNLRKNELIAVPADLPKLIDLYRLDLSYNKIKSVTEVVNSLKEFPVSKYLGENKGEIILSYNDFFLKDNVQEGGKKKYIKKTFLELQFRPPLMRSFSFKNVHWELTIKSSRVSRIWKIKFKKSS